MEYIRTYMECKMRTYSWTGARFTKNPKFISAKFVIVPHKILCKSGPWTKKLLWFWKMRGWWWNGNKSCWYRGSRACERQAQLSCYPCIGVQNCTCSTRMGKNLGLGRRVSCQIVVPLSRSSLGAKEIKLRHKGLLKKVHLFWDSR